MKYKNAIRLMLDDIQGYATHMGWVCKDDFQWFILWFGQERNKFTVSRKHTFKETDNTNSVQSSLRSHSLWVALYLTFFLFWIYCSVLRRVGVLKKCVGFHYSYHAWLSPPPVHNKISIIILIQIFYLNFMQVIFCKN